MDKMFTRIDTVFLPVTDLDKAIGWYRDILGLEMRWHSNGYACFNVGETPLTLVASGQVITGGSHALFNFYTKDIESTHRTLQATGVDVDPIAHPPGVSFFDFRDLDGNILSVCYWKEH